jgi:hypothetical protein
MSDTALEHELTLMRACWAFFDDVRSRVSVELQRGPRGGGRDRDHIVRHVVANERDWAVKLSLFTLPKPIQLDEGWIAHRLIATQFASFMPRQNSPPGHLLLIRARVHTLDRRKWKTKI